jgi:MFS family permease
MTNETAAPAGFFHPTRPIYRFTTLLFISSLSFGSYFAYDIIGAIAPSLIEELKAARATMNTMYSVAAILVLLFGGMLIDRIGTRKASIIFSVLVLAGAAIVWQARSIPLILLGRFIFGAGSEPLVVAQCAMLARWFKNKEMAMAFGVQLTVSRLGSLFAFNTGELFSSYFGSYRYALLAAVGACAISLIGNLFYIVMDKRAEKVLNLRDESAGDKIVFKDIKTFQPTFWYVTFLCLTFYAAVFPFQSLATDFFADKWGIARTAASSGGFLAQVFNNLIHIFSTAGGITSIIIFASMLLAPFAGRLVDRVGKRATFMIAGSLLMIPCHLAMGLTKIYPVYPMILLGFSFVLVPAAMWPSVPLIVRSERVGTAFGLMTAIQNFGLAFFPFLNGVLRDKTGSYVASQVMFASLGLIGLIFAILLKRADRRENRGLEMPQKAASA